MGCGASSQQAAFADPHTSPPRATVAAPAVAKPAIEATAEKPVDMWLASIDMEEYTLLFKDAGYDDMETVAELTESELLTIGITKGGHIKKLLKHAQAVGEKAAMKRPPSSDGKTLPVADVPKIAMDPNDTSVLAPKCVLRSEDRVPPEYQKFLRNGVQYRIYKTCVLGVQIAGLADTISSHVLSPL